MWEVGGLALSSSSSPDNVGGGRTGAEFQRPVERRVARLVDEARGRLYEYELSVREVGGLALFSIACTALRDPRAVQIQRFKCGRWTD